MTRVPTSAQSTLLLSEFARIQERMFNAQQQISTGKKAQTYQEIGPDAAGLLAAKAVQSRIAQYTSVAEDVGSRLEIQNLHLESLADSGAQLRQAVTEALSTGKSIGLMEQVRSLFDTAASVLNSTYQGQYLYAGTRSDVPPVGISDFASLLAAPGASAIFGNDGVKASALIDESLPMSYGLLASDLGTELMDALRRIGAYDAGANGPLTGDLTPTQQAYLESELPNLKQLADNLTALVSENGLRQQQVDRALASQRDTGTVLAGFIADIEDTDLAEAITRLQNDQISLEAATRVFGTLQQSSLLNFLQ
ncbi:MAG: hypothetical protein H6923_01690 [Alphaproteobacteria bacterium]|nr:hypothetical protein [Alphaproteobacteria bacterium]